MVDAEELAPFDPAGELLKEFLAANDVALLRVSYLRRLLAERGVLQRRQLVPKEALVTGEEIQSQTFGKAATRLFVVSHAWLSVEHPDPAGKRLEELIFQIDYLGCSDTSMVFLDYCCLYQVDKQHPDCARLKAGERLRPGHPAGLTPGQARGLRGAVAGVDVLFASAVADVVVLPLIHDLNDVVGPFTKNRREYINRGWCRVEFSIAKFFGRVVNTSMAKVRALLGQDHGGVAPAELERLLLLGDVAFGAPADKVAALALYRRYHASASKENLIREIKAGSADEHQHAITSGLTALHWVVRRDIAAALGATKVGDFAVSVCERLLDRDYRVRIAARDALARMRPIKTFAAETAEKLGDADLEVRIEALQQLSKLGPTGLSQAAAAAVLLSHRDVFVSKAAKDALLKMGLAGADAVAPWLADPDAQTRDAAQEVVSQLGAVGAEAAAQTLGARVRAHVNGGPGDALRELLRSLAATGPAAAGHADAAANQLGDRDASVRCAAMEALLHMGAQGAASAAALLAHHDPEMRVQAVRSLARMGAEGAAHADEVARLLGDESWPVRRHAVHFLASLEPARLEPHALELQRLFEDDPDEDVRHEASALIEGQPQISDFAAKKRQELLEAQILEESKMVDVQDVIRGDYIEGLDDVDF